MCAMQATEFEFKGRFWVIGFIIWGGFSLYLIDHVTFAVALLHLVAPGIDPDSDRGNFWLRIIFGAGALLVFLSALLRTWATAYLRSEVVHDASQHSEALLADGPYRYVRNPLYLANIPLAAGIGFMASRLGFFFMVIGMVLFMYRLILREEAGLLQTQGDSFRAYLKAVPRLWPSLTPRVPTGNVRAHWGQALAGEMFIWLFGVGELCFAITLRFKLAAMIFGVSILLYFAIVPVLKKRAAQSPPSA
jgi:protein-S-isoprenylcysteine O-methyltransferase Ste14